MRLFLPILIFALCGFAGLANAATADDVQSEKLYSEGRRYETGSGVGKNPQLAVDRYCEAAQMGHREAQFRLGWLYANGSGIKRDDASAVVFFTMAANQGHPQAERLLKLVRSEATRTPECLYDLNGRDILAKAPAERKRLMEMVVKLAPEYGIYPRLAFAIIQTESAFNPAAVSPKNAQGLMQLIPETAERFNVRKPFDPEQNIRGGLAYLRWLLAYFEGNVDLAAAAYNAGEGAVDRYAGVPPYPETRQYVALIRKTYDKPRHPFNASFAPPSARLEKMKRAGI